MSNHLMAQILLSLSLSPSLLAFFLLYRFSRVTEGHLTCLHMPRCTISAPGIFYSPKGKKPNRRGTAFLSPEEIRHRLHQLKDHQIRLEIKNEGLLWVRQELETARTY